MRSPLGAFIFISIMLLLDTYIFQVVRSVCQNISPKARTIIYVIYWGITVLAVAGFLLFVFTDPDLLPRKLRTYVFATILGLFMAKFVGLVFFLLDDLRRLIQWTAGKLFYNNT